MNKAMGQHEIWRLIQGVFDSFAGRDVQGMEDLLHEDCTLWDVFEPELTPPRRPGRARGVS